MASVALGFSDDSSRSYGGGVPWEESFHVKTIRSWLPIDTAAWLYHIGFGKYSKRALDVNANGIVLLKLARNGKKGKGGGNSTECIKQKEKAAKRLGFGGAYVGWKTWLDSPLNIDTREDAVEIEKRFWTRYRQVTLRVYDVTGGLTPVQQKAVLAVNRAARHLLGGAYHVGVEVYGKEWAFGAGGIYWTQPKHEVMGHSFRESIVMPPGGREVPSDDGSSLLTPKEIDLLCGPNGLSLMWVGTSYDLIYRNCCHFADVFCTKLGVGTIPKWINRVARGAASVDASLKSLKSAVMFGRSSRGMSSGVSAGPDHGVDLVKIANDMLSSGKISRDEYNRMMETNRKIQQDQG
jgi:hypothetical protein